MKYKLTELKQKTHKKADSDAEILYHRGHSFDLIYQSLISEKLCSVPCDIKVYSLKYPSQHLQQQNADPVYKLSI